LHYFINVTGDAECNFSSSEADECSSGFTCQADNTCLEDTCQVEDHFSCEDGPEFYCEIGQCQERDCHLENCSKLLSPLFSLVERMFTITRNGGWNLNLWDYVEELNDGFAEPLDIQVTLNGANLFMSEEDGIIT
jgi:hypothetical protein